jgi:phosphoribosyl-AMP cyclohydrolase / phosphoribosyl-ATP pyrophosphohydrolase
MNIDFKKQGGLVPAIIQDAATGKVLMLGYMNEEAYKKTLELKRVTFFSRSKNRLWTKGEESGNFLNLVDIASDCDSDALLVKAEPMGPTCHTGSDTCWNEVNAPRNLEFLYELEAVVNQRKRDMDVEASYTAKLFQKGINKIAQKVGEEAVELVIEAKDDNRELFLNEAADLMFHTTVLLAAKGYSWDDVMAILKERHK